MAGRPHSGKVIGVAGLAGLTGLLLIGYGLIFDPFSLPLQDYQQIPEAQQRANEQQAAAMHRLRTLGLGMIIAAVVTLPVIRRLRRTAPTPE